MNKIKCSIYFMTFTVLLLAGCASPAQEKSTSDFEKDLVLEDDEPLHEPDDEKTEEDETFEQEEVPTKDGLEVIDGNPIGEYEASGVTKFIVTKETETGTVMPDKFLTEEHPYIQGIKEQMTNILHALYEVDYQTITDNRHEPFFHGELPEDSSYLDISRELRDEVITEVREVEVRTVNFESGMEKARVGNTVIYYVQQSSEEEGLMFNKYLEGKVMTVNVTSDVEMIDGEWKVTHVIELVPEVLEDE